MQLFHIQTQQSHSLTDIRNLACNLDQMGTMIRVSKLHLGLTIRRDGLGLRWKVIRTLYHIHLSSILQLKIIHGCLKSDHLHALRI